MKQRLAKPYGSLINRDQPVKFSFEGTSYQGFLGAVLPALWQPTINGY